MSRHTGRSAVAAVVAMVTVLGGTAAMAATTSVSQAHSVSQSHSAIFAGYAVSKPTVHVKHVTATFAVPTITCDSSFGGVGPSVLVYSNVNPKTGAHITSGAGLGVACENGNAIYESVVIVNGQVFNDLTVQAGDVVDVSVRVVPSGTTVTVTDETASASQTRTGAGHTAVQTFIGDNNVVVDGESGEQALDPFTPTQVTGVLVNAHPLGAEKPIRYQWVRKGTTLVTASALVSGDGFTLTYQHS